MAISPSGSIPRIKIFDTAETSKCFFILSRRLGSKKSSLGLIKGQGIMPFPLKFYLMSVAPFEV